MSATQPSDLQAAMWALMAGASADSLSEGQWLALYDAFDVCAGEAAPRALRRFQAEVRRQAVDRVLHRWLGGKLAGKTPALATPAQATAYVRKAVYRQCLDLLRRDRERPGLDTVLDVAADLGEAVDQGAQLEAIARQLITDAVPGHLAATPTLAPKRAGEVIGRLTARLGVVLGESMDAQVQASLAAEPDESEGAVERRKERLMRAQRRAVEWLAGLAAALSGREPPDPDGERLTYLVALLRHKRPNGKGGGHAAG